MGKFYLKVKENPKGKTHIFVDIYYAKGGISYFDYKQYPSGLYCAICAVKQEVLPEGWISDQFSWNDGVRFIIENWTRDNKKKVAVKTEEFQDQIASRTGKPWEAVQKYLSEKQLELE
jgi:hypothetical protein